jgi:ligand-binding sensor domain-containing protein/serine phosphatase RsbU (regulator of sigma subunit)/ABC-type amino acid transport substrate-binding protein
MSSLKVILILCFFLIGQASKGRDIEEIKRSGKLYVALTTDNLNSINHDLALEFAHYLNVELIEVLIEWDEALMKDGVIPPNLETDPNLRYTPDALKKADIICAALTITEWRKKLFGFAETLKSAELLVINTNDLIPGGFDDLSGKSIAFMGATTFEQHLNQINASIGYGIQMIPTGSLEESENMLQEGQVYGIILDADEALNFISRNGQTYTTAFPISEITQTAWAVEKDHPLIPEVENFFETIASNGVLDDIFFRRFGITYSSYLDGLSKNLRLEIYHRDLDEILESGKLVVALRERSFVYHEEGQKQFMHALAEEFADYLGVDLEFVVTPEFEDYWKTGGGQIVRDSAYSPEWFNYFDLACETIAPLAWRKNKVNLVPVYQTPYAVIARKESDIHSIEDLKNFTGVTGIETVYEDILKKNGISNYYHENINNFIPDVIAGRADYTIMYNAFIELSDYPQLETKLELGELSVCWALRKDQPGLLHEVEQFIALSSEQGLIAALIKSMHGNTLQTPENFINSYYESFQTGQLPFVNYTADNGLPQEDIFSIYQDHKGYIWFGTNSGAVRYNGREMEVFNHEQGLPANTVRDIRQDSSGTMYFATTSGIASFRGDTTIGIMLEGNSFNKIIIDSRENRWYIGDKGVCFESPERSLRALNGEFQELPWVIYNISEEPMTGRMLMATDKGVFMFDRDTWTLAQLSDKGSYALYIDPNDSIWISTGEGLEIIHMNDLVEHRYRIASYNLNQRLHLPVSTIFDIASTSFGSVWLVTESRIMQVISTGQQPIVYEQETGLKNNKILSFLIDREDNIWIGFSGGLQRLTSRRGLRNFYPEIIDSYIYSIFQDSRDRLWITSDNGIFYFRENKLVDFTPQFPAGNTKFAGTLMHNNNILLANNEGLYEVHRNSLEIIRQNPFSKITHSLESVFVTSRGEIFLLTGINGDIYYFPSFHARPRQIKNQYTANMFQLIELDDGKIIGGSSNGFVTFNGREFELLEETDCNIWSLCKDGDHIWVGTDCGIGKITNGSFDRMELSTIDLEVVIKSILPARNRNYLWVGTNKGFSYYNIKRQEFEFNINTKDGLIGDEITSRGLFLDRSDLLWVGSYHGLSNFNIRANSTQSYAPQCYIEKLLLNGEPIPVENRRVYSHRENNFVFELSAPSFADESSVEYESYLRGSGNKFSAYQRGREYRAYYTNLPPGHYEFIYKAKGKNNIWGYAEKYEFAIKTAWYNTWIFRICLSIAILILAYLFYIIRIRAINAQKNRLEQQVKERTRELEMANTEIESQKEEIAAQRDEVEAQRDDLKTQRDMVILQKNEIIESINYAQRIQAAMLPPEPYLYELLDEAFVLFKPKDIIGGDFYWVKQLNQYVILVAADCTGHGIPGALMSMLGMSFLNEIVQTREITKPSRVLDELRDQIKRTLRQHGQPDETKDGIEMAICVLDKRKRIMQFAGAYNPLYLLQDENGVPQLKEIKGDRMPVGYFQGRPKPFVNHEIKLEIGDTFYIFSDGFIDQKGGKANRKFMSKHFKNLLLKIHDHPLYEQKNILSQTLDNWMDGHDQIDDILIIGGRV